MDNIVRTQIHITAIEVGMTIELNGQMHTVGKNCIKRDPFFGTTFRGDGSKKYLTRIQFAVPTAFGTALR